MPENAALEITRLAVEAYALGKPIVVSIKQKLDQRAKWDPIRSLSGETLVFQSNLFAIPHDAYIELGGQRIQGAPFLKPMRNGIATVPSGYPITGLWDAQGMMYLSAALGANDKKFVITHDQKENPLDENIICFGSASSNLMTGFILQELTPKIGEVVKWQPDAFGFKVGSSECKSGQFGMILSYASPWNSKKRAIVLAGLGPAGTLGAAKYFSQWPDNKVDLLKDANGKFAAAVRMKDLDDEPELVNFQAL